MVAAVCTTLHNLLNTTRIEKLKPKEVKIKFFRSTLLFRLKQNKPTLQVVFFFEFLFDGFSFWKSFKQKLFSKLNVKTESCNFMRIELRPRSIERS